MQDVAALIRRMSFCGDLPDEVIEAIARIAVPLRRTAGATIQIEGDPAEAMYLVVRGRVKIVRIAPSGREQVLRVAQAGEHFNTVPIFDGGPCPANAEALTDVELLALPRQAIVEVVERYPVLALALLREFTSHLRSMVNLVDNLALHTVQGRLAQLLLAQAEAAERGEAMTLTQAEMAARLGTVREMVARTLKNFETLGLIQLDRGTITLIDRAGLKAQADQ